MKNQNELYKFMDVELVLGNPKIECDGYGICKFVQKGITTLRVCEEKRMIDCKISFVEQACIILMNEHTINDKNCVSHFKDDVFRIETPITIPNWITDSFYLSKATIQSGIYGVKKQNRFFQIEIPFVENFIDVSSGCKTMKLTTQYKS